MRKRATQKGRLTIAQYMAGAAMSEHEHQVRLFEWAEIEKRRYPELSLLFAIPNGGHRHPAVAMKLKREGVKSGIPDLCLPIARGGFYGAWIEMKKLKGKLRDNQVEWLEALTKQGYLACVCKGWEEAKETLVDYLEMKK